MSVHTYHVTGGEHTHFFVKHKYCVSVSGMVGKLCLSVVGGAHKIRHESCMDTQEAVTELPFLAPHRNTHTSNDHIRKLYVSTVFAYYPVLFSVRVVIKILDSAQEIFRKLLLRLVQ